MAERRMFAKAIVLSDAFIDMPSSARNLYFTYGMLADDDGFIGSPKAVLRQCGASESDLDILISMRFVLAFPSGVIVIKHWRINNLIRKDRYSKTTYREELDTLTLDEKGAYIEKIKPGLPMVNQRLTQVRLGKVRYHNEGNSNNINNTIAYSNDNLYGSYHNVYLTNQDVDELASLFPDDYMQRINHLSNYQHKRNRNYPYPVKTICRWAKEDKEKLSKEKDFEQRDLDLEKVIYGEEKRK